MKHFLYVDVETTGLKPLKNDVIQLACIPIVNGIPQESFNEFCQPTDYSTIEDEAVAVHGITPEMMRKFQMPTSLINRLEKHLSKYGVRFTLAGFNTNFDKGFIGSLFAKQGKSQLYKELFTNDIHDVYARAKSVKTKLKTSKLKLANLAEEFNVKINAHDALSDITATMEVDKHIAVLMGDDGIEIAHDDIVTNIEIQHPAYLHLHSEFSNIDSVVTTEEWVKWALANKVKALAFPDHTLAVSLFNSINKKEVINKINKEVKAISGEKDKYKPTDINIIPAISINITLGPIEEHFRLNAWATSNAGYFNLVKLSSMGWENTVNDSDVTLKVVKIEDVAKYSEGVVFGTACDAGILNHRTINKDPMSRLRQLHLNLPNLLLELLPFDQYKRYDAGVGFRSHQKSEVMPDCNLIKAINTTLWNFHKETSLPYIVSTAAHFIEPEDKVLQDVVARASFKDGRYFYESRHMRSPQECLAILSRHLPDFNMLNMMKSIETSYLIASKAGSIKIENEYHLPKISIPPYIADKSSNYDDQLYYLLMSKVKEHSRWSDDPVYVNRFKKELEVISKNTTLNFLPYFIMYEDICGFARKSGILQNIGRGSAGGCLISYYLKIIHIDPIREDLPFERFLSHARINAGSFPDIDLDLGERGPILEYLKEKYGVGFAQIGTFLKFKTKNAIKDSMYSIFGRNRNDREIMDVCDTIPDSPQGVDEYDFLYGYTDSEGEEHKGNIDVNQVLRMFFAQYPEIEQVVKRLVGLPKDFGRHPSAFVISTLDLASERVPLSLMHDKNGPIWVTQFESPMVEKSGLVKADILGIVTINTVAECVALIKERTNLDLLEEDDKGVQLLYRLPEDPKVYADFYRRKTDSSFQFNTDLIKGFLQQFAPISRKDLSDLTALCRPGALDVEFLPGVSATQFYIDARNGIREPEYVHEDLKLILKETNAVVVYQEQLMQILVEFCGYSLEESDQIRSAIAKKKHDVMLKAFDRIRESTKSRGWTLEQANRLCQVLEAYSNYSFNKSHSRCYAELGYITMYLKHHYPLEWWTSELNNSGETKMRHYVGVLGSLITPPTLSNPADKFVIVGDKIAAPLSTVKGIGPATIKDLVAKGPFDSIEQFVAKISPRVTINHFVSMVKARVVDSLMDSKLPYVDARKKLLDRYVEVKQSKPIAQDVYSCDPMHLLLNEREYFKCFNRPLLSDTEVVKTVSGIWPALSVTGNSAVPLYMGNVPVIGSVKAAQIIADRQADNQDEPIEAGFIGFFVSSSYKEGVSKKSGRPWRKVEVIISDGLNNMECTWWDKRATLRFPKDTIVYARGSLKKGWKSAPVLDLIEVVMAGDIDQK